MVVEEEDGSVRHGTATGAFRPGAFRPARHLHPWIRTNSPITNHPNACEAIFVHTYRVYVRDRAGAYSPSGASVVHASEPLFGALRFYHTPFSFR